MVVEKLREDVMYSLQIEKPGLRELKAQFLFKFVHGLAKMHFTMDDLAFSLAEPFAVGLRLFYTREPALTGLANSKWR